MGDCFRTAAPLEKLDFTLEVCISVVGQWEDAYDS